MEVVKRVDMLQEEVRSGFASLSQEAINRFQPFVACRYELERRRKKADVAGNYRICSGLFSLCTILQEEAWKSGTGRRPIFRPDSGPSMYPVSRGTHD